MIIIRSITCLLLLPLLTLAQTITTIPKSSKPTDIKEIYKANPHFYEVMSAFPNDNSYYKYRFEEVKKVARDNPEYMVILGDHYRIGRSTPLDHKKAMKEYQRAFSKGYALAGHRIAYMHADGLGVSKDNKLFIEWLTKSADAGCDLAQYDMALVHLNEK